MAEVKIDDSVLDEIAELGRPESQGGGGADAIQTSRLLKVIKVHPT